MNQFISSRWKHGEGGRSRFRLAGVVSLTALCCLAGLFLAGCGVKRHPVAPGLAQPSPPVGFTAAAVGNGMPELSWTLSPKEQWTRVRIQGTTPSGCAGCPPRFVPLAEIPVRLDPNGRMTWRPGAPPALPVRYRLVAVTADGRETAPVEIDFSGTPAAKPTTGAPKTGVQGNVKDGIVEETIKEAPSTPRLANPVMEKTKVKSTPTKSKSTTGKKP